MTKNTKMAPPASNVNAKAQKWAEKHPDLAARLERAKALVASVKPGDLSPDVYFVEGEKDSYMVKIDRKAHSSSCTCPDHTNRNVRCKHILAVALFEVA